MRSMANPLSCQCSIKPPTGPRVLNDVRVPDGKGDSSGCRFPRRRPSYQLPVVPVVLLRREQFGKLP